MDICRASQFLQALAAELVILAERSGFQAQVMGKADIITTKAGHRVSVVVVDRELVAFHSAEEEFAEEPVDALYGATSE